MIADDFLRPCTFRELVEDELSLAVQADSVADQLCDDVLRLLLDGQRSGSAEMELGQARNEPSHLRIVDLSFLVAHRLLFDVSPAEPAKLASGLVGKIPFGSLLTGLAEPAIEVGMAMALLGDGPPASLLAQTRRQHGADEDSNFVSLALLAAADTDEPRGLEDPMTLALAVLNGALARDYKLPVALCLAQLSALERGETLSSMLLAGWSALTEITATIDVNSTSSTKRDNHRIRHVYGSEQSLAPRGAWLLAGAHFLSVSASAIDARAKSGESWQADAMIRHSHDRDAEERTASDIRRLANAASRWFHERCQLSECRFEVRAEVA